MRPNTFKSALIKSGLAASVLLLASGAAYAQSVNLTAAPVNAVMPDGSTVPMWGYSCGAGAVTATCAPLNPLSVATTTAPATWSPVVITVPYSSTGTSLTINLTNNLTFTGASIPTSLVIVGQVGGGLGSVGTGCTSGTTCTQSPDHTFTQSTATWPIVSSTVAGGTPPTQGPRVQSFGTEVAAGTTGVLCWGPGCATPTPALKPGTYLIESGTHPSIQGPMGLYGMLVVTTAPAGTAAGCAYPGATPTAACAVPYNTDISMLMSEIDPVQNAAVNTAVNTAGFNETTVWSGQPGGCGNPASTTYHQCYPPAVDYTPLYYLINGVAFDKTHAATSVFAATTGTTVVTGTALVRIVNAGLRMHVPSIVGSTTGTAVAPAAVAPSGFSLIAEDGNPLPGVPRVQSEVFMAAGKTYDVMINAPAASSTALPIFDRELSLSGNGIERDAGMVAYLGINGATPPANPSFVSAVARNDTYNSVITGQTLVVSDPAKGVIANDTNVYGVQLIGTVSGLTLNANGTFTYTGGPTSFTYCANGTVTAAGCSSGITASVALNAAPAETTVVTANADTFSTNLATRLTVQPPGVLANDVDAAGYPLTVNGATATTPLATTAACTGRSGSATVSVDLNGGVIATAPTGTAAATCTFSYAAKSARNTVSGTATVTLNFPATTPGFTVTVLGKNSATGATAAIVDYRWIIEEDRTFYVNPACTANPPPAGCPSSAQGIVPTFGTNFHTSYMPVVAAGCTGPLSCESGQKLLGVSAVCDIGNGVCRTNATQETQTSPNSVHLDPTKRYYITVFPGDAANPFEGGATGHGMGGAPIACTPATGTVACTATTGTFTPVTVYSVQTPLPPAKLAVFVFEDDFPLNGEHDGGGGIDVLSPVEPGLGGFNIKLFDDAGGTGDATGQMSYDMFNYPLSNSLAGTIDPATGLDACPISPMITNNVLNGDASQKGITGEIVTCPKYESDNATLSPIAGQAVVANLMPGRYGVVATPAADRIARGEEWLQTNTLDGQKAHDSFLRVGEPSFFQEYGPSGYHVSIGFANPQIINDRKQYVCNGTDANITGSGCTNTLTGQVTTERMSRTPDERLYSSGTYDSFSFTQCYVSFGDADGEDFAFTKCNADGTFTLTGLPDGDWRITVFDQWNDMLVDGLSTPVRLNSANNSACGNGSSGSTCNLGNIAMNQWQANIYTRTFFDANGNGVFDSTESGLTLVATNIRFRDGSYSNFNNTDLAGSAGFNEVFPLFSWYVIETDTTRYKTTGTHVVYDAGGPADGSPSCNSTAPCGNSNIAANLANTHEAVPLPTNLRIPGAWYCSTADCTDAPTPRGSGAGGGTGGSTGRVDPPIVHPYGSTYGWQGFSGQNSFLEFGKKPYVAGENGGIHGEVIYASTRPFDDPTLLIHTSWTPDVPGVTINLYQEGTAPDGSTSLKLVDTTKTSSWDDWAQGFRVPGSSTTPGIPNMNCPGQGTASGTSADLFFFSLYNQPNYLDVYKNGWAGATSLPNNSQFKCYDGMHNWNQLQPAPYDGMYQFPSITSLNPTTGKPQGTNCTVCIPNPDTSDPFRSGTPMLPAGKYVVEVVVPPGYELVKEEDKNILIGDVYIAPATTQFGALASIFILPDQAEVSALYNANNLQNPTQTMGRTSLPSHEGDTGSVETFWPCVGQKRIVPDYISLFPQSHEVSPFAGALRPLCDRKEVTVDDQSSSLAKFWIFSSTHVAAHFTGVITDDYTSEFDPFSPQFGEKFSPADLPVSIRDWTGTEISRVYADHWGTYNGLTYSTWEVNPPNPTGYAPTMMVTCMNDPGTGPTPDPLYNSAYSDFCYEIPFMPGQTQYMDTPVVPTSAFAGAQYNNPDCAYPDATPAIKEVDSSSGVGPYVAAAGGTLTITALGDVPVNNYAYVGPSGNTAPYNQKFVNRHYGFGATAGTVALVGADGVAHPLTNVTWSDLTITGTVPTGVPNCPITQQGQSAAQCGELVITAANGKQSIDTVTVTIGGKAPTHVAATASVQAAIDAATPGDMLMIDPTCTTIATGAVATCSGTALHATTPTQAAAQATHQEMLLMWKPVRLQGVGAVSSIINANPHPAGKIQAWRVRVNCLFGLATNGSPVTGTNPFDSNGDGVSCPTAQLGAVDRLPLEATVGWDANLNGNLAETLQEPSLMGALEGAAITVLAKGVDFHGANQYDPTLLGGFPTGTSLLRSANCGTSQTSNPFKSNFQCNPSGIDGLGITNSSQGGGGVFVHGWGHNLQIANNRIYNNAGTLSGGINLGQGEFPPSYIQGSATNAPPGSCQTSTVANLQLPYCHNLNVNMHHNAVTSNSSTGDELFSATPAGAGGVSICTGSDFYKFNYNWVCGNLSTGDGGGLGHIGFSYNGDIEHNSILFNQSTNPTIPANGGGLLVMGAPDADPTCGATTDQDCVPAPSSITPSDGTGPNLVINANLIMGNSAESGSGGGVMFQQVNGTDVTTFPTAPTRWNSVRFTNNIVANNVAGWDGAGISMLDALNVNIVNNTVISNDTTASAGVLFNTIGAPRASTQGTACTNTGATTSCPQPAGLVVLQNSAVLVANLPATITCPTGHFTGTTATNANCRSWSVPLLYNDVFWQNRAFDIQVGALGTGTQNQQNVVTLVPTLTQGATGQCVTTFPSTGYWDLGARGDTGPGNHGSGLTLAPTFSDIGSGSYTGTGTNNISSSPAVSSQYCNGSRIPPEYATVCPVGTGCSAAGYFVPPGISDATVPNPIFNLTPAATVDEGNNWINMAWGPLSLTNPTVTGTDGNYGGGLPLGNYQQTVGSPVIDAGVTSAVGQSGVAPPTTDFFGNTRPQGTRWDMGAFEGGIAGSGGTATLAVTPTSLAFGNQAVGTTSAAQTLTLSNTGTAGATGITATVTAPFARSGGTCGATLAAATTCTINVVFSPTATGAASGTATITANVAVSGSPVALTGTGTTAAAGTASVSPTSLAFGNQAVGTTSGAQAVTVTNTGTVALAGGTFTFGGGTGFARAGGGGGGTCTATLAVGASCTYNVVFSPTAVTTYNRTLTVAYSGATVTGTPVALTGTGTGTAAVTVTPASLTFGAQATGTTSAFQTLTLSNTTAAPFTGLTATFTGPFSRAGGGGANCGTTLASGGTCTIRVQFSPTAVGAATGSVAITGSATVVNSPVTLSGTGVQGVTGVLSPSPIVAPAGPNPQTGSGTVTLTNTATTGGASVTITAVTVPAPGSGGNGSMTTWFFMKGADSCTGVTLPPGGTCTVVVTFTSENLASGSNVSGVNLTVTHNGVTNPTVALSGHKN
jgi:hypothetical protein